MTDHDQPPLFQSPKSHQSIPSHPALDDTWLETLLRNESSTLPNVEDSGFTASVVNRLPARIGRSPERWIVPAMGLLGFLIGLVWLSGGERLFLNLAELAQMKSLSLQTLLVTALPLGLLYWLALGAAWQEE